MTRWQGLGFKESFMDYGFVKHLILFPVGLTREPQTFATTPQKQLITCGFQPRFSDEVCLRDSTTFIMCPLCRAKGCRFKRLKKSCGDIVWSYFFDSPASVFLAFIAPIFGSLCLRLWTYQQSKLAYRWHMQNYKAAVEPARWQFSERLNRKNHSLSSISLSIGLELVTDIIASRLEIHFMQSESQFCNEYALYLAFGLKTFFNASCVCILSSIYRAWIRWSTNLECHRTQDQQVQCILMKSCLMEFINVFLSLFTSILFRALNYGYPGQNLALFEPLEWPVWTGMFGVFYEAYIKCTVIVFVKSAFDWLPLSQVKKTVMKRVRLSVFGRSASPQRVEFQSLSSSPTYKHCLDNFKLDTSGEHLLFQRQFNMSNLDVIPLLFPTKMPPQACLIAFASEFINKLVYKFYYSPDGSMMGYANFSLSYMDVSQFEVSEEDKSLLKGSRFCRYFGYREPPGSTSPYSLTSVFWHILAAKFIFVFVFIVSCPNRPQKSLNTLHCTMVHI
ncbi:Anoctamin-4 [Taenia solium]|eukprot:TsM_000437300 transcript=TsM_000437300 gene=TsM_000437300